MYKFRKLTSMNNLTSFSRTLYIAASEEIYGTKENYYLELYQTQGRRKWWDEHNTLLLGRDFVKQMTEKLNGNLTPHRISRKSTLSE